MEYIALAIAPGIAICLYIFYKDIYNREPGINLVVSFLLGCIAILPAAGFENAFGYVNDGTVGGVALFTFFIVGFSEEACKFLGLRLYSYNQKSFDEPLDGIVYAVMVSMGFATIENVLYAMKYQALNVIILRMFLSVPAHATFAIIMGYFVGKAKFSPGNSFSYMFLGLLGAIFFHGTFDFFIFASQKEMVGEQAGNGMLAGGALVSFIISLVLCRKLIRRQRSISAEMFKDKNKTTSV